MIETPAVLDIDAVAAFVLVADLSSFTRAAEALGTSQAAVSLKVKRLEQKLGRRLLERTPRRVGLTLDGQAFVDAARALVSAHGTAVTVFERLQQRKICIGVSMHVMGAELPALLQRMHRSNPAMLLELHVGSSANLINDFEQGRLDAALVLQHDKRKPAGRFQFRESFGWMAKPDFEHRSGLPLRLATEFAPCGVRAMALASLDQAAIAWTEVFSGGGIATLGAAVLAGFALAPLGTRVAPAGAVDLGPKLGLPPLPARDVVLYSKATDKVAQAYLKSFVAAVRATST